MFDFDSLCCDQVSFAPALDTEPQTDEDAYNEKSKDRVDDTGARVSLVRDGYSEAKCKQKRRNLVDAIDDGGMAGKNLSLDPKLSCSRKCL